MNIKTIVNRTRVIIKNSIEKGHTITKKYLSVTKLKVQTKKQTPNQRTKVNIETFVKLKFNKNQLRRNTQ